MKCESCGKKLGLFGGKAVKLDDGSVCEECFGSWGFSKEDLRNERYKGKSWMFLRRGKAECDAILDEREYDRTHTKEYKSAIYDLDEATEKKIIKAAKELTDTDDLYGGWTIRELKEAYNENKHHIFGGIDFDCELVEEGDGYQIIFEDIPLGTVRLDFLKDAKKYKAYLIVNGGKYRQVEFDADLEEAENVSDAEPYWFILKVVYVV